MSIWILHISHRHPDYRNFCEMEYVALPLGDERGFRPLTPEQRQDIQERRAFLLAQLEVVLEEAAEEVAHASR